MRKLLILLLPAILTLAIFATHRTSGATKRAAVPRCRCLDEADVDGLPVVELPVHRPGHAMAVLISGDGGWRAIDREVAAGLAARGVSVVGLVSPQYFSARRTPEEASCALQRIIETYSIRWKRERVIVIGYSRGAGVAPFMINRLPEKWRARVSAVALIGLDRTIDFRVTAADLLRSTATAAEVPVRAEIERMRGTRILCFYGDQEGTSLCRELAPPLALTFREPGTHHFTGNYDDLARTIWEWSGV